MDYETGAAVEGAEVDDEVAAAVGGEAELVTGDDEPVSLSSSSSMLVECFLSMFIVLDEPSSGKEECRGLNERRMR